MNPVVFPRIGSKAARLADSAGKAHGKISKPWKNIRNFFQGLETASEEIHFFAGLEGLHERGGFFALGFAKKVVVLEAHPVFRLVAEVAAQFQAVFRGEQSAAGEDVIE